MFLSLRSPRQVITGPGSASVTASIVAQLGERVLVVSDGVISSQPAFSKIVASMEEQGLKVRLFLDASPEVPVATIAAATLVADDHLTEVVVGIGGGSVIDLAKIVALLRTHGGSVRDYYGECKVPGPTLPVVALPTTAGTGSEVTPVAVVSDPDRELKIGLSSVHLVPTFAICDPELTVSCPPGTTAHSGADALCHAVESFTARVRPHGPSAFVDSVFVGKNPLSDQFALRAVAGIARSLRTAVRDGTDLTAREDVMVSSTLAGFAFAHAGTGAPHAMQYPIGADTHTPHGLGVGLLLPYVLTENRGIIGGLLIELAETAGLEPAATDADTADAFIQWVWDLSRDIGLPASLDEIGLERSSIPDVARRASLVTRLLQNNPGPSELDDLIRILDAAWVGDRHLLGA